jgi:hypothetical protein
MTLCKSWDWKRIESVNHLVIEGLNRELGAAGFSRLNDSMTK